MTEYKITLYYEKPMPKFFQNSMVEMLDRAQEQGIITGYEFDVKTLEKGDKEYAKVREDKSGHDKASKSGDEDSNNKGKAGRTGGVDKEIRSDKSSDIEKDSGRVRDSSGTQKVSGKPDGRKG